MEKIKWGVLGTAGIAKGCTIPGMLLAENCELVAIAGRSLEKAEAYQKEFGFRKVYNSYEALLADPEIQAVYIPLPNNLHCEWAIKAVQAKKHVLCEKPIAPDTATAERMFAAANENGVLLMEAFAYLHTPIINAIKAEIDAGTIGKLNYVETAFTTSSHDLTNICMRKETYGGAMYDLGCYCTSLILRVFDQEPETVKAIADFTPEGIDAITTGLMTFPGGGRAMFNCGMVMANEKDRRLDRMIFEGEDGVIVTASEFNQAGDLQYTVKVNGVETVKTVPTRQNYSLEIEQLGRCIAGLETPFVSNAFSLANARTMDRVLAAIGY